MYIFNQRQLEKITHAKLLSMAAFNNEKGAQEVLAKYVEILLPTSAEPKKTSEDVKDALDKVVKMGSFVATPLDTPSRNRRMVKK